MTSPRVTVILSSFNHARFVGRAIQSVLDQTFTDFELFVIDDCSEDDSWAVIQSFNDSRITAIRNSVRLRAAFGFNETIRNRAKGEFIAIHHSDDVWLPEKLEKQVAFLEANPEIGAVFTRVDLIDEAGYLFNSPGHFYSSVFGQANRSRHEWLHHFFFKGNCLCHPSILARRYALLKVGLYDRRLGQITDFDLWVRLCLEYEIHILNEVLTCFRVQDREANQSGDNEENHIRGRNEWSLVLGRLLRLHNEADFFKVFPEMLPKAKSSGNCLPFLLALCAINAEDDFKMAFGLGVLYSLLEDEAAASEIHDKYDFRYIDLIKLSARINPFNSKQWMQTRQLEKEIARLKGTISWRITAPLRAIANFYRSFIIKEK